MPKNKAVFLDRDGVCNPPCGTDSLGNPESPLRFQDFQLFPFVGTAVRKINQLGFLVFIVTNQPAVAKGKMPLSELDRMHDFLKSSISKQGGRIQKIYQCLHHPDARQVKIKHLLTECSCRKPEPGMLFQAALEFQINLKRSWMIVDSWKDVVAGEKASCRTILISPTEENLKKCKPDFIAEDLIEAIKFIKKEALWNKEMDCCF